MPRTTTVRVEFTKEHDAYLAKYLARYCPSKEGRSGRTVFQRLVDNKQNQWPWSVHHTWQSWRERYVKNSSLFDAHILKYQAKHDLKSVKARKRAGDPMPIEMLGPSAKRIKLEAKKEEEEEEEEEEEKEKEGPGSETRTEQAVAVQRTSPSSTSIPKEHPREPDIQALSPPRPSTSTNIDVTKNPILDLTTHDTLEVPSSPPNQQPTDATPDSPRPAKHIKKRSRVSSDIFASEPSSPRGNLAVMIVGGPSSQTQPVPSAPSTRTDDAPVFTATYPRAPPRIVDSLHGQVLVDQRGHVPRALPPKCAEEEPEEEPEDKVQWPPPRGRTAKQRKASGPDVGVDTHHPFSQPQPLPLPPEVLRESAAEGEPERGKLHALENVSRNLNGTLPDRRAVVARFIGEVSHDIVPLAESERQEDGIRNSASPVERIAPPTPSPLPRPVPKPSPVSKFPAPRASTASPFRPESPAGMIRHPLPPLPQPRPQSRTKAARHPALTRIRQQTMENRRRNRPEHGQVPSIDLVALSHSSMSVRSHSRSSTGTSVPARPSRWSLPAFTHATPWALHDCHGAPSAPGSVLGSGSWSGSPFRWVPPPAYGDHARRSTPWFAVTPSPGRSITDGADSNLPSLSLAPHLSDLSLTASHGLASILAHMSANHGLALSVVEAVYTRVGSLKEADEVLRGMREAAERYGEKEIKRRVGGRKQRGETGQEGRSGAGREEQEARLRYVVASEDGEGSEYSPPETSRAAMWKRQSESEGNAEEGGEEEGGDDEGLSVAHHDFSRRVPTLEAANNEAADEDENRNDGAQGVQGPKDDARDQRTIEEALTEHIPAQELERKIGRGQFRKDIVKRFV